MCNRCCVPPVKWCWLSAAARCCCAACCCLLLRRTAVQNLNLFFERFLLLLLLAVRRTILAKAMILKAPSSVTFLIAGNKKCINHQSGQMILIRLWGFVFNWLALKTMKDIRNFFGSTQQVINFKIYWFWKKTTSSVYFTPSATGSILFSTGLTFSILLFHSVGCSQKLLRLHSKQLKSPRQILMWNQTIIWSIATSTYRTQAMRHKIGTLQF